MKPTPTPPLSPEEIAWVKAMCPTLREPHRVTPALKTLLKGKAEEEAKRHPNKTQTKAP